MMFEPYSYTKFEQIYKPDLENISLDDKELIKLHYYYFNDKYIILHAFANLISSFSLLICS